jgi:formylglycine-generating enzyme
MGTTDRQLARANERPRHKVTLTRGFWIKKTEVTQEEWRQLMGTQSSNQSCANCPVANVSWHDAVNFANAASRACGLTPCYASAESRRFGTLLNLDCRGFRLPLEAEWELAAKAGHNAPFWNGDPRGRECASVLNDIAWHRCNANDRSQPVGTRHANPFGLFDMQGNVSEWVSDGFVRYPSGLVRWRLNPQGPALSRRDDRVVRGGHFRAPLRELTSTYRETKGANLRSSTIGFRIVRTAPRWSHHH